NYRKRPAKPRRASRTDWQSVLLARRGFTVLLNRSRCMRGVVRYHLPFVLSAFVALSPANRALAHRIPSDNHDRTIVVRLSGDAKARQIVVEVTYTLEVDEDTAILTDLQAVRSKI